MKKVVATHSDFLCTIHKGITTIHVYEGEEFPSDWSWLRKFLTTWTLVSTSIQWGKPTMERLRERFGDDVTIKKYY